MTIKFTSILALIGLTLTACGSDDDEKKSSAENEDPAEHACEHVTTPGTALTAAPDQAGAPILALSEETYTVSLPAAAAGYLKLQAPAEAILFVGTASVTTGLFHEGDTTSELPAAAPNEFCGAKIPEHYELDLHGTGNFILKLGPASVEKVWLMYTPAAGHGH